MRRLLTAVRIRWMHLQTAWLLLIIWLAGVMLAKIYRKTATEYAGSTLSLSPVYSEFIPGVDVVRTVSYTHLTLPTNREV